MTADPSQPHADSYVDSHAHSHADGPSYLWAALLPLTAFLALVWGINQHALPWKLPAAID